MAENKKEKRTRRHRRVRSKIQGTAAIPRLSVFRSRQHIYAQLIDDQKGRTILQVGDSELKKDKGAKSGKIEPARQIGKLLAEQAVTKKIKQVVFDRGGYKYHGRVKALAEGARQAGLKF